MSYGTFESLDHEGYHATVAAEKREETLDRAAARVMENVGDYFRNSTNREDFNDRWKFAADDVRRFIAMEAATTDENVDAVRARVAALATPARDKTASLTWDGGSPGFDTDGNPYPTIRAKGASGILYVIAPDDEGTYILTAIEGATSTIFADGFPEQECKEIAEEYEQTKTAANKAPSGRSESRRKSASGDLNWIAEEGFEFSGWNAALPGTSVEDEIGYSILEMDGRYSVYYENEPKGQDETLADGSITSLDEAKALAERHYQNNKMARTAALQWRENTPDVFTATIAGHTFTVQYRDSDGLWDCLIDGEIVGTEETDWEGKNLLGVMAKEYAYGSRKARRKGSFNSYTDWSDFSGGGETGYIVDTSDGGTYYVVTTDGASWSVYFESLVGDMETVVTDISDPDVAKAWAGHHQFKRLPNAYGHRKARRKRASLNWEQDGIGAYADKGDNTSYHIFKYPGDEYFSIKYYSNQTSGIGRIFDYAATLDEAKSIAEQEDASGRTARRTSHTTQSRRVARLRAIARRKAQARHRDSSREGTGRPQRQARRTRTAEAGYPPVLVELTDLIDEIGNTPGVPATASSTLHDVLNADGDGGSAVADRIEGWMNSNDMELFPSYSIEALRETADRLRGQEGNYLTARRKSAGLRYETIYGDYSTQEVAEYNGQKIVIDRTGPSDFSVLVDGQKVGHERTEAEAKALAERTVGVSTARKQAWTVSDDGMTYTSDQVQSHFDCPSCGNRNGRGFSRCACGKQWNSYSIDTPNGGQKMIAREVEARPEAVLANRRRQARRKLANTTEQVNALDLKSLDGQVGKDRSQYMDNKGRILNLYIEDVYAELVDSETSRIVVNFDSPEEAAQAFQGVSKTARRKRSNKFIDINPADVSQGEPNITWTDLPDALGSGWHFTGVDQYGYKYELWNTGGSWEAQIYSRGTIDLTMTFNNKADAEEWCRAQGMSKAFYNVQARRQAALNNKDWYPNEGLGDPNSLDGQNLPNGVTEYQVLYADPVNHYRIFRNPDGFGWTTQKKVERNTNGTWWYNLNRHPLPDEVSARYFAYDDAEGKTARRTNRAGRAQGSRAQSTSKALHNGQARRNRSARKA